MSNVNGNGISSPSIVKSALSSSNPASYHYTSSTNLLTSAKPVPPPTLPKSFTPSNNPSPYRLASLDRIAQKQRLFDASNGPQATTLPSIIPNSTPSVNQTPNLPSNSVTNPTSNSATNSTSNSATNSTSNASTLPTSATSTIVTGSGTSNFVTNGDDSPLLSKRELFFKNELPPGANTTTNGPSNPSSPAPVTPSSTPPVIPSLKESLAKRIAERGNSEAANNESDNKEKYNKVEKEKPVPERKLKELDGYVGFANLPNQVYRKAVKKGFEFTIMVVGESGLGKSTLLNSMFLADIYSPEYPGPSLRIKKTIQVETSRCLLKENGVNLTLTVVDTPGFGDAVDNSNCWQPVIDYVESRYEEFLNSESRVNRRPHPDSRVHCCLYFIAPSGHGLKPLDVEFMQRLHEKVNIIPVIAKADTMTPDECTLFKKQILNEIAQHKIKIYEFPETEDDEDSKPNKTLRERVPFAIVGSNTVVEVNGKKLRGRKYPWGVAEVENLEHCDFIALRNMLIRTHLQDLKDVTNNVHYENFRCRKLAVLGPEGNLGQASNKNPLAQMEEEKREHDIKIKKLEVDMEQVFEMKVKEKKQKVKESELDLQKRHEQMRRNLEQQIKELEEKKKALEIEKSEWEQMNNVKLDELRRRSLERENDAKEKKKKKGLFHS